MYQAPVQEYDFLYLQVFGPDLVNTLTGGEVKSSDVHEILTHAADFAVEVLHPLNQVGDRVGSTLEDGCVTTPPGYREAYRTYAEGGWVSIGVPKSAGGEGMPWSITNAVNELWAAANVSFSLCSGLSVGAALACHAAATDEQRTTYLEPLISGRWTGTMNLTEPHAGTDLASIRTIGKRNDDGTWSLKGQKIFITWGDHDLAENIVHLVLARTEGAPAGLAGLSLFIVPKFLPDAAGKPGIRNSVETLALEHKLGIHSSPTCVLEYDGATGFLLGEQHKGLAAMFVMMNVSRIGIGLQGLGVSDRAYQLARDYAATRVQGRVLDREPGTPISGHPDVARLLLSMSSSISAQRALSIQVAQYLDEAERHGSRESGRLAEFFVPILKSWLTEEAVRIASDAVQVHGGSGFIEETGAAQHYRDARILPIYEGTTAIQANDLVGRKFVRDQGAVAEQVFKQIEATLEPLRGADHLAATKTAERLERALAAGRAATSLLLERANENSRDVYAASVAYLTTWGLLAGGWMHGRMLLAALAHSDENTPRRIAEADFFGAHHLSKIHYLVESIEAGEIS
ncbi:acyl-CoA dehydrogenase [Rhodococcus qingshengii]|uniref:acyl-CoA dehydrogenase n=1 Tax=Rhodococcus qingshengii TaxID=334542 RepID=UPI001BE98419|nr:acyl-CoA dehydrogenase [Rhodococcus qingshengii]MBT2275905.1 acyl-CoA dehydrogenase [Rhodococcus qingshengii]